MPRTRRNRTPKLKVVIRSRKGGQPKRKSAPSRKGLLTTVLDTAEHVAAMAPGIIKGVRNITGFKTIGSEAQFATPASFAVLQNNVSEMAPEVPVTHPTKGCTGVRVRGVMPFGTVRIVDVGVPPVVSLFASIRPYSPPSGIDQWHVSLNPLNLGGSLAVQSLLYDNYVCRRAHFKYITSQTTTYLGTLCMCVEKDAAAITSADFDTARQVIPNVVFPVRIPEAVLKYGYDGPDMFFVNTVDPLVPAEVRQDVQAVFGLQSPQLTGSLVTDTLGYIDLEYEFEFYNRIPPKPSAIANTLNERRAIEMVLERMRGKPAYVPLPKREAPLVMEDLLKILSTQTCSVPESPPSAAAASIPRGSLVLGPGQVIHRY